MENQDDNSEDFVNLSKNNSNNNNSNIIVNKPTLGVSSKRKNNKKFIENPDNFQDQDNIIQDDNDINYISSILNNKYEQKQDQIEDLNEIAEKLKTRKKIKSQKSTTNVDNEELHNFDNQISSSNMEFEQLQKQGSSNLDSNLNNIQAELMKQQLNKSNSIEINNNLVNNKQLINQQNTTPSKQMSIEQNQPNQILQFDIQKAPKIDYNLKPQIVTTKKKQLSNNNGNCHNINGNNNNKNNIDSQNNIQKVKAYSTSLKVMNQAKTQEQSVYSVIKQLFNWLFTDDGKNPLWLFIANKSLIKNFVFLQIKITESEELQKMMKEGKLNLLSKFYNMGQYVAAVKDNYQPVYQNLWYSIFADFKKVKKLQAIQESNKQLQQKQKNEQNIEKLQQQLKQVNGIQITEELIQKYNTFVLTQEQMYNNNYPTKENPNFDYYVNTSQSKTKTENIQIQNKILSVDCEMVRTNKNILELARVTLINFNGEKLIDDFVKPPNPIIDYNTQYSGITQQTLQGITMTLQDMQQKVLEFVNPDVILVGHSLENDLNAMQIQHSKVIDSSILFLQQNRKQSLKSLTYTYLNQKIQQVTHDSLEDAVSALNLIKLIVNIYPSQEEMKKEKQAQFTLIEKIQNQKKNILIVDNHQNVDLLLKTTGINHEQIDSTENNYKEILEKMNKWISKSQNQPIQNQQNYVPNLLLSKIQQNKTGYQLQYLLNIDSQIQKMYDNAAEHTVFCISFDMQDTKKSYLNNVKPFLLFFQKPSKESIIQKQKQQQE